MKKSVRIGAGILGLLTMAVAAVAGGGYLWLRQGLPDDGTVALAGITAPVKIARDAHGVPHIFADSQTDAYVALGYVHAQDRLWQMDMQRRVGAGRLSELIGENGLGLDRFMRVLDLYGAAGRSYEALAPEVRQALDAYASGVNAWLEAPAGPLPLEFQILRYRPEPWRPADSLVWGKLMSLQLSGNYRSELETSALLKRLSPDQIADLHPDDPADAPVTLAAELPALDPGRLLAALPPPIGPATASNEWVVAGDRTVTGSPILANDPHLGLETPILWYLAHVEAPDLMLSGATVPGVPFHLLGHNGRMAWGFTTTGSDVQDLFIERLDPDDPDRYLTPAGSETFALRQEEIAVHGGETVRLQVRTSRHGPILSDIDDEAAAGPGHVIALAFPGLSDRDTTAEALYRLNRAGTWQDFRDALRFYQVPQQNIVFADVAGNIGFLAPGLVPVRKDGDGRLPVPGWTGDYDWTGFIPFDEMPQSYNPVSGVIVNANNRVVGPDYPYLLTHRWESPYRAERIDGMLADSNRHSVERAMEMLGDTLSLPARELLPLMLETEPATPLMADALGQLRQWDGRMLRHRPEPLVFAWWLRELNRALYADELGPMFLREWGLSPRRVRHMLTETPVWCDDIGTETTETCADILRTSLEVTLEALKERHGPHLVSWRWAAEHVAPLPHQILSRIPLVSRLFDLGVETDGSHYTVNRGAFRVADPENPFAHVHGAGLRAVYDLADLANSRFMVATGQSGNPLSPHYGDLVGLWRDVAFIRIDGDKERRLSSSAGRLTLLPP